MTASDDPLPTVNEELLDRAIRHAVYLERLKGGEVIKIIGLLNTLVFPDLIDAIMGRLSRVTSRGSAVGVHSYVSLKAMLVAVNALLREGLGKASKALKVDLGEIAISEADWQVAVLNRSTAALAIEFEVPSPALLRSVVADRPFQGALAKDWFADLAKGTAGKVKKEINLGLVQGESIDEIVARLRGTKANGFKDGVFEGTRRDAETIVRTSVNHTVTQAREETFKANEDLLKGEQWRSTLDLRTSAICVVGSTPVDPVGRVEKLYRRWYEGDVIVVRTASGKQLVGTPNHPVLTSHGWRALEELEPGKQVLYSVSEERGRIEADENVRVPSSIAQLFNAAGEESLANVLRESSSAADFHGDGAGGDGEVDILEAKCSLRLSVYLRLFEHLKDDAFGRVELAAKLVRARRLELLRFAGHPPIQSAKLHSSALERSEYACSAASDALDDLDGPDARFKELYDSIPVALYQYVALPALEGWHDSELLQKTRNCGRADFALPSYLARGRSTSIQPDDVVDVRRERRSCHVYNLQTCRGVYIAGGLIVHNCQSLDGKVFPVGEGPRPPAHPNCRSKMVPLVKSFRELGKELGLDLKDLPPSTRASMDGQVPADLSYVEWLRKQSAERQDTVLGQGKGKLFRAGLLDVKHWVDDRGRAITLEDLRALEGLGS